jgi:hypothetical protein
VFGVVAYFLDDGDLRTVLAWLRRVARRHSYRYLTDSQVAAALGLLPLDRLELRQTGHTVTQAALEAS